MDPDVWGPILWDLLFSLAFKAPKKHSDGLVKILSLLEKVIPCQHCRRSYTMYRKQIHTIHYWRRHEHFMALYLWTVRDMVNQHLGRTRLEYGQLRKRHMSTSTLTNDLNILDVFCLMAWSVNPEHVLTFVKTVVEILKDMQGFDIVLAMNGKTLNVVTLVDELYAVHCDLYARKNMTPLTRQEFDQRYDGATVDGGESV